MKKIDQLDLDILALLHKNARLTNKEIAELVGVAASTCLERIRRLQTGHIIKGFHADVHLDSIGGHIQAMVEIRMAKHTRKMIDDFRDQIKELPEIVGIYHMGGKNDFLVHVTVRNTEHLRDFVFKEFTSRPEVVYLETSLIYESIRGSNFPNFLE